MSNNAVVKAHVESEPVTIREAKPADLPALRRLAQRDSARMVERPAIVALVEGRLLAAMSIVNGSVIADPFHRTAELVELLRLHARQARRATAIRRAATLRIRRERAVPRLRRAV